MFLLFSDTQSALYPNFFFLLFFDLSLLILIGAGLSFFGKNSNAVFSTMPNHPQI